MKIDELFVTSADWEIHLKRTWSPDHMDPALRPIVIVPGYGMNSFIFGFHPRGTSMERVLAEAGFEVWSTNLRGQDPARPVRGSASPPSLRSYAETDLTTAINRVLDLTHTDQQQVDLIGASLGGSIVYGHLALHAAGHNVGAAVTIGAPLRWEQVHPALKLAFASPDLVGLIRFSGTQRLAQTAFPLLAKVPGLMSLYMNTAHIDMSRAAELTQTVSDPHPRVNRDIAKWIRAGDMVLRGTNVTEALGDIEIPLLVVLANRDGIVPPATALPALDAWGGDDTSVLEVGTPEDWYAHADLFVGHDAKTEVFEPIGKWLKERA